MIVDLWLVYSFIRRLATPFEKWPAYEAGVIDKDGNILKSKKERNTRSEKDSFGVFDLMILKLKKLLANIPGGSSRLASYAAALWLIKEWNHFSNESLLNENVSEDLLDDSLNLFFSRYCYYTDRAEDVNQKMHEEPTVNVGSGNIAGLGVGPQGEPGLTPAQMKKYKKKNTGPKRLRDIIGAKV
jgi:hypothetical protein